MALLIDDFIEVGFDFLNPVQTWSGLMSNMPSLKKLFRKNIYFCGVIDTHRILPHGSVVDVLEEVGRLMRILGLGGGCIILAMHTVMNKVPPENILAMVDALEEYGRYFSNR